MGPLAALAEHNAWANARVFAACEKVSAAGLIKEEGEYDSVIGILQHLVQVEFNFLALAQGRERRGVPEPDLAQLKAECSAVDAQYVSHARSLDPQAAEAKKFLVPWFGFEITLAEGILQPLTHSHKHRADVSMLLPRLGGEGVEMDLIQWLDESRGPKD